MTPSTLRRKQRHSIGDTSDLDRPVKLNLARPVFAPPMKRILTYIDTCKMKYGKYRPVEARVATLHLPVQPRIGNKPVPVVDDLQEHMSLLSIARALRCLLVRTSTLVRRLAGSCRRRQPLRAPITAGIASVDPNFYLAHL